MALKWVFLRIPQELGGPYVKDFLKFIKANIEEKAEILEIGAGTGYLSKLLMEDGHEVDALEPGKSARKPGLSMISQ